MATEAQPKGQNRPDRNPQDFDRREVRAEAKYVRISPRKARLVAEHIRGRSVPEARAVLAFTSREAALALEKVLQSAVANAEANHGIAEDRLYIKAAYVDGGPVLKRWRARARGRVARIRKRTCHITVLLAPVTQEAPAAEPPPEVAEEIPKPKRPAARKTTTTTARKTATTAKKKTASKRPAKKKEAAT
jgi:large subunit ribosomal protein L22